MGSIKKLVKASIKDANIEGDPLKDGVATTAKFVGDSVESGEINDGTVTGDDLASPLNLSSKTVTLPNTSVTVGMLSDTLDLSSKSVTLADTAVNFDREYFNISLLGFKMAVTESLTVFNLVDGVVDEFHDESGTDEAEGSNDNYCATNDLYDNVSSVSVSAGFSLTAVTEEDTSEAGTNPARNSGQMGTFTVPSGVTSLDIHVWGAGGGGATGSSHPGGNGGGGGYSEGTLAVTASQTLKIIAGEGGAAPSTGYPGGDRLSSPQNYSFLGGGRGTDSGNPTGSSSGGGLAGVFSTDLIPLSQPQYSAPTAYVVAGSGAGGGGNPGEQGGAGGGLTGCRAGTAGTESVCHSSGLAGGGDQEQGGNAACGSTSGVTAGSLFRGGDSVGNTTSGGGAGYYGGGGGNDNQTGGGGSSYYGHPQVTSGATEEGSGQSGGGTGKTNYQSSTNEGQGSPATTGEDGYVLLTGSACLAQSTVIVSNAFTSTSVATTSRIVVFEENIDTPTLNTDIIASVSRDGGTTFTNATLTDSGYVTGSSGQRILTGQATISGQPSGQSMRWKLALANNQVKIHGVSLSWA